METIMAYAHKYSLRVSIQIEPDRFSVVPPHPPRHMVDLTEDDIVDLSEEDLDLDEIHRDCERWMASELVKEAKLAEEDLDLDEIHRDCERWMASELVKEEAEKAKLDADFEVVWAEYLAKRDGDTP
jgi:hypothetical protein